MASGRHDFEIAASEVARGDRVRRRVRAEVGRMAAVAGFAAMVMVAMEAAVVAMLAL